MLNADLALYVLMSLLGVSAGIAYGVAATREPRRLSYTSGVLTTVAGVFATFAAGADAPWGGPLLALVTILTALLVAERILRNHPGLLAEPYWRRVFLVSFRRRQLDTVRPDTSPAYPSP